MSEKVQKQSTLLDWHKTENVCPWAYSETFWCRIHLLKQDLPLGSPEKKLKETFDWMCAWAKFGWEDTGEDICAKWRNRLWQRGAVSWLSLTTIEWQMGSIQCWRLDNPVMTRLCGNGYSSAWVTTVALMSPPVVVLNKIFKSQIWQHTVQLSRLSLFNF